MPYGAGFGGHRLWAVEAEGISGQRGLKRSRPGHVGCRSGRLPRLEIPQCAVERIARGAARHGVLETRSQLRSRGAGIARQRPTGACNLGLNACAGLPVTCIRNTLAAPDAPALHRFDDDHRRMGFGPARDDEGLGQRPEFLTPAECDGLGHASFRVDGRWRGRGTGRRGRYRRRDGSGPCARSDRGLPLLSRSARSRRDIARWSPGDRDRSGRVG